MFWIRSNDLSSLLTLFFFKCQSIYESRCTFEFLHIRLTLQNHPRTLSHKTRSRQTHNKEVEVESRIVIGIPFYSQTTQQRVERRIATRSVSGVKEGARNQVQVWRNFFQSVCWNRQATGWQPVGFSPVFFPFGPATSRLSASIDLAPLFLASGRWKDREGTRT